MFWCKTLKCRNFVNWVIWLNIRCNWLSNVQRARWIMINLYLSHSDICSIFTINSKVAIPGIISCPSKALKIFLSNVKTCAVKFPSHYTFTSLKMYFTWKHFFSFELFFHAHHAIASKCRIVWATIKVCKATLFDRIFKIFIIHSNFMQMFPTHFR